jgi:hypothetical protein
MGQLRGSVSVDGYLGGLLMVLYKSSRRYPALMVLSALIVGAAVYFFSPRAVPVYGGAAQIQLGAVAGATLISAETATATINAPAFRQKLAQSASPADASSASQIAESLAARLDSGDLITVGVRAFEEQSARRAIEMIVRLLTEKEDKLGGPLVADLNEQVADLDAYIASLTKIQDEIASLSKAAAIDGTPAGDGASPSLTAVSLLGLTARNTMELHLAKSEKLDLQKRLGLMNTYPVRIVDDVSVSLVAGPGRPWRTAALAVVITVVGFLIFALTSARRPTVQS